MNTPLDETSDQQQELSSFTVNPNGRGGFRGIIKVEHPYRPGEFVTRAYNSSPIYVSGKTGNEFGLFTVSSDNPINQSREHRINPNAAPNAHPGLSFRAVNQGVYFLPSEDDLEAAKAAGKPIPAIRAYVTMPFKNDEGQNVPHVVELAAWPQKPKNAAPGDDRTTWYAGPAKIFDPAAYLANSRTASGDAAIDTQLDDEDWRLPQEPGPELERQLAAEHALDAVEDEHDALAGEEPNADHLADTAHANAGASTRKRRARAATPVNET
ncbi:MAG: hypothetical protein ACLPIX_22700 [Rhodomicrobium sp.]